MMPHLSEQQLTKLLSRELSSDELAAAERHIAECPECRNRLDSDLHQQHSAALLHALYEAPPTHLTYEQLTGYADHTIDAIDMDIVEGHLQFCDACKRELAELQVFDRKMAQGTEVKVTPAPESFWRRWTQLALQHKPQFALAAAAVVVAGSFVIYETVSSMQEGKGETASLHPQNGPDRLDITQPVFEDTENGVEVDAKGIVTNTGGLEDHRQVREAVIAAVSLAHYSLDHQGQPAPLPAHSLERGHTGALLSPAEETLEDFTPEFHWAEIANAKRYQVSVFDHVTKALVQRSPWQTSLSWETAQPLEGGHAYDWRLAVNNPGQFTADTAPFAILSAGDAAALGELQRKFGGAHLVLGSAYWHEGLVPKAEVEFKLLAAAHPQSPVPNVLLKQTGRIWITPATYQ